jgi:FkbM family methyltransferase
MRSMTTISRRMIPAYRFLCPSGVRRHIQSLVHQIFLPALMCLRGKRVSTDKYVMFLNPWDEKGTATFFGALYGGHVLTEPFEVRCVLESARINSDCSLIDVGANFGLYTLEACSDPGGADFGKVIAIEPCPITFSYLAKSVDHNGFAEKVLLVNAAVSDIHNGSCSLVRRKANSAQHLVFHPKMTISYPRSARPSFYDDPIEVRSISLDGLLEEVGIEKNQRFLIKIDVEGMEPAVLSGMERILTQSDGYQLFFEYDYGLCRIHGYDPLVFAERLFSLRPDCIADIDEERGRLQRITSIDFFKSLIDRNLGTNIFMSKNLRVPSPLVD